MKGIQMVRELIGHLLAYLNNFVTKANSSELISIKVTSLKMTLNGLNPEIIRDNWRPGDEYWVIVWWKNYLAQDVYYPENLLRTFSPNKGKNMNNVTTNEPVEQVNHNFYIDAEGNRVEIPFDIEGDNDGQTYSGSETASAETTEISEADRTDGSAVVYVATDEADHPVTVH